MTVGVQSLTVSDEPSWLHTRNWDLKFISLSVVLVPVPYLIYLFLMELDIIMKPLANEIGTSVDDLSRNTINFIVALLIGGPHMYATFSRTALDNDFARSHTRLLLSSLVIPVIVIALALFNLPLLLTAFFFWASVHVLHQIIFITELYNHKSHITLTPFSRLADYAVILTSLYPLAAWKMSMGEFVIGKHDVGAQVNDMMNIVGLQMGDWVIYLAGGAFAVSLGVWIWSTLLAYQQGTLHGPKTLFIGLTVLASFFVPALGNLDTAFQGMNFWHSLQYLALTWMLNNLRQKQGLLKNSPMLTELSTDEAAQRFYWFNFRMMVVNLLIGVGIFGILVGLAGKSFDFAFDRSYYIAVLSILWIHYYQDHFLFTEPEIIQNGR
jgi:hypothetical protein